MQKAILKLVLGLAFFSIFTTTAQQPLAKKETQFKGVYDYANMMSADQVKALSLKLIRYADTTSTQIAVATIESLNGQDISMVAVEKAHEWGIGQKGKDNGVFILISKEERKIKIATGYGVEHLLTDYTCKQIINDILTPHFKHRQYYKGLNRAVNAIIKSLSGEYKASPKKKSSKGKGNILFIIIIVAAVIFFMNRGNNSGKGGNNGKKGKLDSSDILTAFLLGSMGSGRGYRGGSSSGGFGGGGSFGGGSFGGGGFGGGGASGDW